MIKTVRYLLRFCFLTLFSGLLVACYAPLPDSSLHYSKQSLAQLRKNAMHSLKEEGTQVREVGHRIQLMVPTDKIFRPESANWCASYELTMHQISRLLHLYSLVTVKVTGYTDSWKAFNQPKQKKQALSAAWAQRVIHYLRKSRVDARLLYATGAGVRDQVASDDIALGRRVNRRVVIIFRYYPDGTIG